MHGATRMIAQLILAFDYPTEFGHERSSSLDMVILGSNLT